MLNLIEICGKKIWPKSCLFEHIPPVFSKILYIDPPSVIHFWKAMAMRIKKLLSFILYVVPINAQNFDDTVDKLCML